MQGFWPTLPKDEALFLFLLCLIVGAFVIFMFCLDQFGKPSVNKSERDPWKFIAPTYLTSRRQYLIGFSFYCSTMMLIFVAVSVVGPERILQIVKGSGMATADVEAALKNFSTFPVVIAFIIVGLHPSLHLPKSLDFETFVRGIAHRMAYIPKNMDQIFNYMRFSDFDLSREKVDEGWSSIGLRRLPLDAPDLNTIRPLLDRTVVLYALATKLAGEGKIHGGQEVVQNLSLDVFRQYREEIENIEVSLQAVYARLAEVNGESNGQGAVERRRTILPTQKELIKSLEFLYVIFACAITGKGMDRISERLATLGFTSSFGPNLGVPWDPILKSVGAAAVVLTTAWLVAAHTIIGTDGQLGIATETTDILRTLLAILIVHLIAIAQSLRIRTRLIASDEYFSETGKGHAVAYMTLFLKCAIVCFASYLILNINVPISALLAPAPPSGEPNVLMPAEIIEHYVLIFSAWTLVPAGCGVMTAYTIDRPADRVRDRFVSGILESIVMALAALLALELIVAGGAPAGVRIFNVVLYGGLGFVLGFMLPFAIRQHWAAVQNRLPDKIVILRTSVLQYFHNIQQFTDWLYIRNEHLTGRRPLDVLAEESGLQQLISFVTKTRTKILPAAA